MRPHRVHSLVFLASFASVASVALVSLDASARPPHHSHDGADDDSPDPCADDDRRGGAIDVSVQVKPNGSVDVHQFGGAVRVAGWAQSTVHVKGELGPDCHVDVLPSGDREEIRLSCLHGPGSGELEIQVPQASALVVRTMSADVAVHGVNGAVHLETVAGDIELKGGTPSEIDVRSTSGTVTIDAASPSTRAHSVSGDVRVRGVRGRAVIRTVSGECTLVAGDSGEFSAVEIESVTGDVTFGGGVAGPGMFEMQSHSGDITLHLPPTTGADVEMRSNSGDLVIDMGSGRKAAERELDARIGPGGARLRLRSFSGDIKVTP
jgi:DUF4097 and DUF4098 domain-containing protein YvlB